MIFGKEEKPLADGLRTLLAVQKVVSSAVPGAIYDADNPPTKDALRTYSLAFIVEMAEWLQELDFKPWKNGKPEVSLRSHPAVVAEEFADMLAFLGILISYMDNLGITPDDLARAYVKKSEQNIVRINHNMRVQHG